MRLSALPFLTLALPFLTLALSPLTAAYTPLSDDALRSLPTPSQEDFDPSHPGPSGKGLLAPLLIPRVPGTPGQQAAQQHFISFFRSQLPEWRVSWQNSTGTTPRTGDRQIPFQNIILRREPPWIPPDRPGTAALLTLVAHYDSKIEPEGFLGATDSAAPCAVLMFVAREIEKALVRMWSASSSSAAGGKKQGEGDVGVQILLLDGEEAFVSWTDTDSLYGARSLADEWEATPYPAMSTFKNPLRQISLFVLLDLLGAANPEIPSYFQSTHWAYQKMATLEGRLRSLGVMETKPSKPFLPQGGKAASEFHGRAFAVGDDHVPFMARGAPVLHLIPSPFPRVWHTMEDDGDHLDMPTVRDWARLVTAFTLEWMDVQNGESKG